MIPTSDRPLLYPCGQMETMSKHIEMSRVDKVVSYQTCRSAELESELASIPLDLSAVVFFSPSGVKYALKVLLSTKTIASLIAIGPTTYKALENALTSDGCGDRVVIHQAKTPSPEGVKRVLDLISH